LLWNAVLFKLTTKLTSISAVFGTVGAVIGLLQIFPDDDPVLKKLSEMDKKLDNIMDAMGEQFKDLREFIKQELSMQSVSEQVSKITAHKNTITQYYKHKSSGDVTAARTTHTDIMKINPNDLKIAASAFATATGDKRNITQSMLRPIVDSKKTGSPGKILAIGIEMMKMLQEAMEVYIAVHTIQSIANNSEKRLEAEKDLVVFAKKMKAVGRGEFIGYVNKLAVNVERMVREIEENDNAYISEQIKAQLESEKATSTNYRNMVNKLTNWFTREWPKDTWAGAVYDALSGWDNHTVKGFDYYKDFRIVCKEGTKCNAVLVRFRSPLKNTPSRDTVRKGFNKAFKIAYAKKRAEVFYAQIKVQNYNPVVLTFDGNGETAGRLSRAISGRAPDYRRKICWTY